MLSTLRAEIGSLDQVAQILKVFGMVNVAPGFADGAAGVHLASVLDGCANQLTEIFGNDAGTPARVAVGMAELPLGQLDVGGIKGKRVSLSHLAIPVLDVERSIKFYEKYLQMKVVKRRFDKKR